jgi:hypothetical protein
MNFWSLNIFKLISEKNNGLHSIRAMGQINSVAQLAWENDLLQARAKTALKAGRSSWAETAYQTRARQ